MLIKPKIEYFIIFTLFFLLLSIPPVFALEVHLIYDENGNLITGDGKYREYNEFNQLIRVRAGFNNISRILEEYVYHPTEDRILEKRVYDFDQNLVEIIIYANDNLIRKINSTGTFDTVYVKDEQGIVAELQSDGKKIYYHNDHLGSTTLITNQSGGVVENTSYAPFGEILQGGNISRFDYEGKEFSSGSGGYGEGTQDYDYNFRKYDPGLKIFTKPESLFPNVYDPQQLNRYAFERNNPYRYVDPSGNIPVDIVLDIGFIGYDIYTLATQGIGENNENLKALGLDIGGAVIPYATGLGATIRVGKTADKVIDTAKTLDKASDTSKFIDKTSEGFKVEKKVAQKTIGKIETIAVENLPEEAQNTLKLIEKGGPLPYKKDASVFENREKLLPKQSLDYYKEYTVKTKNIFGRGQERIVGGKGGEIYYSKNHYKSFKKVVKSGKKK